MQQSATKIQATNPVERARQQPSRLRRIIKCTYRFALHFFAILGLLSAVYHLGFDVDQMISPSMSPTLWGDGPDGGDQVLCERITYTLRQPRRWEIVRFRDRYGMVLMKRVAALPGETIGIADGRIVINGKPHDPPRGLEHLKYIGYGALREDQTYTCGNGYFLLGDDSKDSHDSRFEKELPPHRILARSVMIVWPPNRMRWIVP